MPQMSKQLELPLGPRGETPESQRSVEASKAPEETNRSGMSAVMEMALQRPNMQRALKRVRKNKGSPGVDGMTVEQLPDWLRMNWLRVRKELLAGTYRPSPVRRHLISKPGGGQRELGIPTVLDRLIQQALLQVLQPQIDPSFSDHSYGFRPGRSAHGAIRRAQSYIQSGREWVVDVDLARFFDRVHHDILMDRLGRRICDPLALGLIRRYLSAGLMDGGVVTERYKGTPQGGPLSPLLANVLLDEVDRELETRGHRFVRYADDCNVYVGSKRAGDRVMALMRRLFAKLKLEVNESKSAVARVEDRRFLGFTFGRMQRIKIRPRVSDAALARFKTRIRRLTRRSRGRSLEQYVRELRSYLLGWKAYFGIAEPRRLFHQLDRWILRRLALIQLRQWKRGPTAYRALLARGLDPRAARGLAANIQSWWKNSKAAAYYLFPRRRVDQIGLPRLGG